MALTQSHLQEYDFNRMVVLFTMTNDQATVACAISTDAMDQLEGSSRTSPAQCEQQFLRLRDRIEARAARKFSDTELEAILPAQSGARSSSLTAKLIWRRGNKLRSALPTSLTLAASKRRIIPNILAKSRRKPLSRSQSIRHDPFRDRHQEGRKP
jgi:hypothetical protein